LIYLGGLRRGQWSGRQSIISAIIFAVSFATAFVVGPAAGFGCFVMVLRQFADRALYRVFDTIDENKFKPRARPPARLRRLSHSSWAT